MAYSSLLSLSLCFLVFFHGCFAQIEQVTTEPRGFPPHQRQQRPQREECQLDRISAVKPNRRIQSEAGVTDVWDENDFQFQCAGVVAMRHVIQLRGLLLPQYVNGPTLVYVVQGIGVQGVVFPGCPETFQSSQSQSQSQYSHSQRQSQRDQHQKVRQIREGDVIALPTGVAQWVYNNGRTPLVLVQVIDTNNPTNQLDQNHRVFFVAGNPQQDIQSQRGEFERGRGRESSQSRRPVESERSGNVFSGMDERVLAEAFNVNTDLARRLRGEDDYRGIIVNVQRGLEVISPQRSPEEERQIREEQQQREFQRGSRGSGRYNGVEETFCTARLRRNVNDPSDADIFNPRAGRVTNVNSHNLPILRNLQLSVQRGVLYRNAIFAPHWNVNSHSISYITRGSGRIQIVDDNGNTVFDGQVQEGQMLTAPQNFVVVKRASVQGLEWVSFKTNDAAKISQLAGRVSAIRSMPVEVVANAYQVSREDARRLKESRQEVTLLSPWSRSRFNATEGNE
ncbi:legumin B-like [Hevea brasiliensis]|uniref:legumin B-like n=1 Tax=Hevea brasiliensis TaxID=3981 RepID=UPI0025FE5D3A|nr:legumin B-like [Hevea brasiliensis]